jgi:hypothetical protein
VSLLRKVRRRGYVAPLVAAIAWVVVAIVLAGGELSGARTAVPPSGASPACLPRTVEGDARLPGTTVDVSPQPGSDTASPHTQISFLGTPAGELQAISVRGARSGYHAGRLAAYSQGDGASFLPAKPFDAGERVSVRALIGPGGAPRSASFSFRVGTPYPTDGIPAFPNPPAPPASYGSFVSEPTLHPPTLEVTQPDRDPGAGELMMTAGPGPGQYGPLIYTPQGRLVWFGRLGGGLVAEDLDVQRYEGQDDLTWWQGKVLALGFGQGQDLVVDRNYRTVAAIHAGNGYEADLHDFQIAPHGVAYITVYAFLRCDLSSVGGKRNGALVDGTVQALDMKTGLVRWEWHSVDHVDVRESRVPAPPNGMPWDWFHLNSLDPQPDGEVLISARSTWAAYLVQGSSGRVLWQLGGVRSSFAMDAGSETAWQHDARMHADGTVTLFDNGSNPRVHYQSRALRLALDAKDHRARLARAYVHPGSPLLADSQGNAQTLRDGNTVIGWGAVPSVSELSADGRLLLDAHLPPGTSSYRAFRFPWHAQPPWAPAVSARVLASGDSTAVFASWNGATDVAWWQVLAGAAPSALTVHAKMPHSGFESSITFPEAYDYVSVQALGAAGEVLGTSPVVKVQRPGPPRSG